MTNLCLMQTQFKCVKKMWELKENISCFHLKEIGEQGPTTTIITITITVIVILIVIAIVIILIIIHLYTCTLM